MNTICEGLCGFNTPRFKQAFQMRPYTDSNKIIFSWDKIKKDYDLREFSNKRGNGLLTYQEVDIIVNELSSISNWDTNMDSMTCLVIILSSFFCLTICVVPIFMIGMTSLGLTDEVMWLVAAVFSFVLFTLLVCFCYRYQCVSEDSRMMRRESEIKAILN